MPLLAGAAASVAVGVGASIARLARKRRSERVRRLGLAAGEPLGNALQRMALGQLDLVLEILSREDSTPDAKAVHETRKALKRLRALLRLLRPELGEGAYLRESAALRDAGRKLAGARDAEVMLATLEGLIKRKPRKLAGRGGVIALRARLLSERESARRDTLGDPRTRTQVLAELRACSVRVSAWRLPPRPGLGLVEGGLVHLYRQGRRRWRRAASAKPGEVEKMHEWRKRVKDLRYVTEMLQPVDDPRRVKPAKGKRARRRQARAAKDAARLRKLARRADRLGEVLGEDHDLAVLGMRIELEIDGDGGHLRIGRRTGRILLKLISRRRRDLRKRALREGARLYSSSPKELLRRVGGVRAA